MASSTTRIAATRALLWFASGSGGFSSAQKEEEQPGERHQDRHQRDVRDLGPEHQALRVLAQVLAHFLEREPALRHRLAEALELRLLLGAHDLRAALAGAALGLLQRLQLGGGLLQLVL